MGAKILIVDDAETSRQYIEALLSGQGYHLALANDGVQALGKIAADKPDLVILDIVMPEMDGIECCRQIKSEASTRDIKVVMVTAKSEYNKVKEAFAAGCDDYLTKPVNRPELLSKVKELLKFCAQKERFES